jgi:hypothetical protein
MSLLIGCQKETESNIAEEGTTLQQNDATEKELLYENEEFGISIQKNSEWNLQSKEENDNLNIILSQEKLTAIVSSVSTSKSFDEIKAELLVGAGDVEFISDDDSTLSFQSKLKNAIRTDVYFKKQSGVNNYIIIFMSPVSQYDKATLEMDSLLNHIEFK